MSGGGAAGADAQRSAEALVAAMLAADAFAAWLGVELLSVGPGRCAMRMRVREEMQNGFGVCHGGVTFALADCALAAASNTHGTVTVSVENTIAYPAAVRAGEVLVAEAVEETAGARLAFYRVTVRNEGGAAVALFTGTVYRTARELQPGTTRDD